MKNFPKLSVFVLAIGLLLSYSCKKDEAVVSVDACAANATLVSNAASVYANSPTKTNCETYLASVNKYLDSCPGITTAQRAQYKADIAATKCQ
jgi:hypothetical protein